MRICFGAFDLNGDGFIDPPEMQTGFTSLYRSMADSGGALQFSALVGYSYHHRSSTALMLTLALPGCADMKLDPMEISVAVATLVNSPANQAGDLDLHAFTDALEKAGVPGAAVADCFRTDSGVCLGSSL